jgi:hypothetical protein
MSLVDFREGVDILMNYYDDPNGSHLGVENDMIYLYETDKEVSEDDIIRLNELGFDLVESLTEAGVSSYDNIQKW